MAKFDRYLLSQLLVMFGFFALVLVALFWINRAVVLFDRLIGDGQSALVFLEFTSLSLPKLITTVLPIAAFAGAVYVTNRMSGESELTVLQSTGTSPWRLARPVLVYGLCVALMMSVLSHYLVPMAQAQLNQRENEISQNVTSRLLTEGTFLHPTEKVTFYTRLIDEDGVLRDVFLSDRRDPEQGVIYTAAEAYLVRNGDGTTLIMVDGLAQRLGTADNRLATAKFRDFSFDISGLMTKAPSGNKSVGNMITPDLIGDWDAIAANTGEPTGSIAEELHARFAQPLFCVIAAMVGFATLLLGGFSRFGVWREVAIAFGLLISIDGMRGVLVDIVRADAQNWPLLYLPSLVGFLLVIGMLWQASNPGWLYRLRRRRAAS
ncbi:LPS export ABC transporter permease LptF [Sulfitobacter mediterraneus]|uniref:LPS export ABC transporter permease LptF n=1 Tax=Sulfitobacter mediterraneus TaxID=83219 RepID=UPI0019333F33|nr:LPS export ABC transporter permease LptF [Sulfitobacter mediterraneus]MBM1632241.1 LPS export ABC transporter permease LptF [Sulfitobacter mediterraneus]MBM1640057.1 LPS export ABC transporter permease LptF [Sulfitobacter mediterraneus]MBM1644106.1 LPS export ABC transporter permease LptF [Sulfitobacter mediterraneus]MBM1648152.1 LPS export ABC transporter permease LptF [Sulfitobacter mediterraneus]MBM1652197.1 LPS export ABC transporter permease LptF [Sulfitobacter mediterraneus]